MRVLWIGKTGDANAWYHIYPFVESAHTSEITVVRSTLPARDIESPKLRYVLFGTGSMPRQVFHYLNTGLQTLRRGRHDVVVSYGMMPWGFLSWILSRIVGRPIVIGLIGSDYHRHVRSGAASFLLRFALRRADVITVPGAAMKRELAELIERDEGIHIYPHCLPPDFMAPRQSAPARALNLITVCALNANKRILDVLEAVSILAERSRHVRLRVLGDGEQLPELKAFVRNRALESFVSFEGHVENVLPHLDRSSIFVQASLHEGLSLSLIEALGRELVPVTTVAGSEEDLIEHGANGLFFEKRNPADLAAKLEYAVRADNFPRLLEGVRETKARLDVSVAIAAVQRIQEAVGPAAGVTLSPARA